MPFILLSSNGAMSIKQSVMVEASMRALEDGDGFCEVHVNTPGGILVAIAFVAASSSMHLSRKVTLVLRLIRVCPQCQKAGQSLADSLVGDPSHLAPWNPY